MTTPETPIEKELADSLHALLKEYALKIPKTYPFSEQLKADPVFQAARQALVKTGRMQ